MRARILRKKHVAVIIIVFLFLSFFTESFLNFYKQKKKVQLRDHVSVQANIVQTALLNEINSSLNLVLGLVSYISTADTLTYDNFNRIAETLYQKSDLIRNIGLAPDNVIKYMYPLKGNEKAIGLDYLANEAQRDAVLKAIKSGKTVIAGPVDLVQGGRGFIARIPIYKGKNKKDYWGLASIVVDEMKLYSRVRILHGWHWLQYALKGKDAKGKDGEIFFGDKSVFDNNPVTYNVYLPQGFWVLAAYPKQGWDNVKLINIIYFRTAGYSIAVIVVFLLFNLFRSNIMLTYYAHIDPLTGISNRRSFHFISDKILTREKRESGSLYFIYFDLDRFKSVNDKYGHRAGDAVLKETVKRINKCTRESDIFARMGGDEFLFVPLSVKEKENAYLLAEKIHSEISKPFFFEKKQIDIGCSIGLSMYPEDGGSIDELVKLADHAMYASKNSFSKNITFYNEIETVIMPESYNT